MKYLLSGEHYTAPDRGSPEGHWKSIEHDFTAGSDGEACSVMKRYLAERYSNFNPKDFRNLRLLRTVEVDLSYILA